MQSTPQTDRNVFSAILKGELNSFATAEVATADAYLDAAIDALDMEEPQLCRWLETNPDLQRLLQANITATARMIYRLAQRGVDYNDCMARVNALFFRVVCAGAYYAVQNERPDPLAVLRGMVFDGTAPAETGHERDAGDAEDDRGEDGDDF